MYAVVKTGGKQYKVEPGTILSVEYLEGNVGEQITFSEVLLLADDSQVKIGQPLVKNASVSAKVLEQKKGKKLLIFKKIRRHGKQLTKGHRQLLTRVKIEEITGI